MYTDLYFLCQKKITTKTKMTIEGRRFSDVSDIQRHAGQNTEQHPEDDFRKCFHIYQFVNVQKKITSSSHT